MVGAMADVGEATSAVTVHALNLTNQVAHAATTFVAVAANNGLTAGSNLWKGVDLGPVRASRCGGSVVVTNTHALQQWLDTPAAEVHFGCLDKGLKQRLIMATASIQHDLPYTQAVSDDLDLQGTYMSLKVGAQRIEDTRVLVFFEYIHLFFEPRWANPFWKHLGCALSTEREQMLKALRMLLLELPAPPQQPALVYAELAALPQPPDDAWPLPFAAWWLRLAWSVPWNQRFLSGDGVIETGLSFVEAVEPSWLFAGILFSTISLHALLNLFREGGFRDRERPLMICASGPNRENVVNDGLNLHSSSRPASAVHTPRPTTTICSASPSEFEMVEGEVDLTGAE